MCIIQSDVDDTLRRSWAASDGKKRQFPGDIFEIASAQLAPAGPAGATGQLLLALA